MSAITIEEAIEQVSAAGWPRMKMPATYDRGDAVRKRWPAPFISDVFEDDEGIVVNLGAKNLRRASSCIDDFRCQVCGAQCDEDSSYAPLVEDDVRTAGWVLLDGGPVCSMRCAKMAITWCPHFTPDRKPFVATFRRIDTRAEGMGSGLRIDKFQIAWQPTAAELARLDSIRSI